MKPFRATYTPFKLVREEGEDFPQAVPDTQRSREVLIVAVRGDYGDYSTRAVFVDKDLTLGTSELNCFSNCQVEGFQGLEL